MDRKIPECARVQWISFAVKVTFPGLDYNNHTDTVPYY